MKRSKYAELIPVVIQRGMTNDPKLSSYRHKVSITLYYGTGRFDEVFN